MVLDASLLNTQHYKVRIKGKVEQSREGVVAIEKGAFGLPSTKGDNFTYLHQIQSREWEEREQTNKRVGLTQVQKESYVTLCACAD